MQTDAKTSLDFLLLKTWLAMMVCNCELEPAFYFV